MMQISDTKIRRWNMILVLILLLASMVIAPISAQTQDGQNQIFLPAVIEYESRDASMNHESFAMLNNSVAIQPAQQNNSIRFAIIGDYGKANQTERDVANMVDSKNVDFIATVGDNVYSGKNDGSAWQALENKVGAYYGKYIKGENGVGSATENKFFPLMGNHDYGDGGSADIPLIDCDGEGLNVCSQTEGAWYNYFDLPGNERTYSVRRGAVEVFLFSDHHYDADWSYNESQNVALQKVKNSLRNSTATWKIVLLHYPPYVSNATGGNANRRYDFEAWGADAVIAGHNHFYERLEVDGLPYFVNGAGGEVRNNGATDSPYQKELVTDQAGAMIVDADSSQIRFKYFTIDGNLRDSLVLSKGSPNKFEIGSIMQVQPNKNTWHTINLQNSYSDPVVVMGVPTSNGTQPMTMRVRNVSSSSFDYQLDEWDYLDGYHVAETVAYIVMEAGTHTIDGRKWHAVNVANVNHGWKPVSLPNGIFGSGATLLAQAVANNSAESAVTTRIRNFGSNSFDVRVQEEQLNDDLHANVEVGVIATWSGDGTMGGYQTRANTDSSVNHEFGSSSINFGRTFTNPLFFAQITTYNGSDTVALRSRSLTATGAQVKLEEEKSQDDEIVHVNETVKWLVIGQ